MMTNLKLKMCDKSARFRLLLIVILWMESKTVASTIIEEDEQLLSSPLNNQHLTVAAIEVLLMNGLSINKELYYVTF